jgi:hypothetical protein
MASGRNDTTEVRVVDGAGTLLATVPLSQDGDYLVGRDPDAAEIALPDASVSRRHCLLRHAAGRLQVADAGSANGTRLGSRRVGDAFVDWDGSRPLHVGVYTLFLGEPATVERTLVAAAATAADRTDGAPLPPEARPSVSVAFPAADFAEPEVEAADLAVGGRVLAEVDVVSIGGGPASFALVDVLRCRGLAAERIRVVGPAADPLERLVGVAAALGLGAEDRLRANGVATLDNLWGVPGYRLRESGAALRRGRVGAALAPLVSAFLGSSLGEAIGPRLGDVRRDVAAEGIRIGWAQMLVSGRALAVRKTTCGRWAVAVRLSADQAEGAARNRFLVARHLHFGTGWPPFAYGPLVERFRRAHRGNYRVAALREPHDTILAALARDGGTVALIGEGFDAFVALDRLIRLRPRQRRLAVVRVGRPFAFGDEAWPRSAYAGAAGRVLPPVTVPERDDLLAALDAGSADGWYRAVDGEATDLTPTGDTVTVTLAPRADPDRSLTFAADFVLDGREPGADPLAQPLFGDLLATYGLARAADPGGPVRPGLAVDADFAVVGLVAAATAGAPSRAPDRGSTGAPTGDGPGDPVRGGAGLAFASGLPATGCGYGPVDSFLGGRRAALAVADRLAADLGLPPFGAIRSAGAWSRRIRGRAP